MSVFEIVAGTYEEFLLGYIFDSTDLKLTQSFATHNHTSSVRCVATAGQYVASGSADDRLMIYDMKKRKEHCMLTHHNATVNAVQFTANGSHILSGSQDGVLCILKTGNWKLEKVWDKAHKGDAIQDIAVHSSGKLALTLGQDYALRTWNLVKGRQAYAINLTTKSKDFRSLEKIAFCDDGIKFLLYGGRYTEIWSIETGGIIKAVEHQSKVSFCVWTSNDSFLSGHEDGTVNTVYVTKSDVESVKAHNSRVKSIVKHSDYVITASSNGEIKVWTQDLEELAKTNSGCRITCLCILPVVEIKKEKEDISEEEQEVINVYKGRSEVVIEMEDEEGNVKKMNKKKKKKKKIQKNDHEDESRIVTNVESILEGTGEVKRKKNKKKKRNLEDSADINGSTIENGDVESACAIPSKVTSKKKKKKKSEDFVEISESIVEEAICEDKRKKKKHKRSGDFENQSESMDGASSTLEELTIHLNDAKNRKRKSQEPNTELKVRSKKTRPSSFTSHSQINRDNCVRPKKKKNMGN